MFPALLVKKRSLNAHKGGDALALDARGTAPHEPQRRHDGVTVKTRPSHQAQP